VARQDRASKTSRKDQREIEGEDCRKPRGKVKVIEKREVCLATETVEGTALALEGVDNIEGGDCLALGVFSIGDCITDDALEEGLEDTTGFFVDHG